MAENSGPQWVERFPSDDHLSALAEPFHDKAIRFVEAMRHAAMQVTITAVYRPPERAYLMHYAWAIAKGDIAPSAVPSMAGVDIVWNWSGARPAAQQMVNAYGIVYEPALQSRHTQHLAIDMVIEWIGEPTIVKSDGSRFQIDSKPAGGQNKALWEVGSEYGVHKLATDPPHWSSDGH